MKPLPVEITSLDLGRINYDLYYRVDEGQKRGQILAFWHAKRGNSPPV